MKTILSEIWPINIRQIDVLGTNSSMSDGQPCLSEVAATFTANSLEYSWVVQHHSVACYPDYWSQPVKVLTEFSQTEDYKTRLAACISASVPEDIPSHIDGGSIGGIIQSKLPASMEMKCSAPHLHRWNPSASSDFTDYFHDRIKVLSTGVAIYRWYIQLCLWGTETVQVTPLRILVGHSASLGVILSGLLVARTLASSP